MELAASHHGISDEDVAQSTPCHYLRLTDLGAGDSDRTRQQLPMGKSGYFVRFRMRAVTHAGRPARLYCAPNISGHNVYINERCWSAEFSDINV